LRVGELDEARMIQSALPLQEPADSVAARTPAVRLVVNHERSEPSVCPVAGGEAVLFSARSPDKLTANEDAAAIIPITETSGVLVVADGLGGGRAGQEASSLAVNTIARIVRQSVVPEDLSTLRSAILDGIETANAAIQQLGVGAATTLAVVEIVDGEVRPYHVGDSMILVTGGLGKVKLLTVSHAPVAMAVESGLMDEQEAMHHEHRHLVSNVVGSVNMRIEIGARLELAPRDTLLLASDGLADNLHTEEIIAGVRKGGLVECVNQLTEAAHARMSEIIEGVPHKPDDLTVIAFRRNAKRRPRRSRRPSASPVASPPPATPAENL
jgi:PPM family protein phosphatase